MAHAVIMAGGQGERFWPLTHAGFPKYRAKFDGKQSLLQKTYRRLLSVYPVDRIFAVTTREHLPMVREELPRLERERIIVEPSRRNTAAAILLSCLELKKKTGNNEVVSFFPADHLIRNEPSFKETMLRAIRLAGREERLVTVGIRPTFAATGYGYIRYGKTLRAVSRAHKVVQFVEKPGRKTAARYVKSGKFLWNAGIFTWRIGVLLEAMKKFSPGIFRLLKTRARGNYRKLRPLPIDRALLEKADNVAVLETSMDWCDMGSWDMLFEKSKQDSAGSAALGCCFHHESSGSFFMNGRKEPLIALGVENLIVIQTSRGTLVTRRGRSEEAALLFRRFGTG